MILKIYFLIMDKALGNNVSNQINKFSNEIEVSHEFNKNYSKFWYGNPKVDIKEGEIHFNDINFKINKNFCYINYDKLRNLDIKNNYNNNNNNNNNNSSSLHNNSTDYKPVIKSEYINMNENKIQAIRKYIINLNLTNNLLSSNMLCCIVPNKISICEFLYIIETYISFINKIRVLKSHSNSSYIIHLLFKSVEFSNVFFNSSNYIKISPLEEEYLIFSEVINIFDEGLKFNKKYSNIIDNHIDTNSILLSNSENNYILNCEYHKFNKNNNINISNNIKYLNDIDNEEKCNPNNKLIKTVSNIINDNELSEDVKIELLKSNTNNLNIKHDDKNNNLYCNESIDTDIINNLNNTRKISEYDESDSNTCPICLEKFDKIINTKDVIISEIKKLSGIVYGLCNHFFHINCLMKTEVSICPLCRYNLSPENIRTCKLCYAEDDLWMCLICGDIHCGEQSKKSKNFESNININTSKNILDNNKDNYYKIGSSNHRYDHFLNTNHQHCKLLNGDKTYDFILKTTLEEYYKKNYIKDNDNSDENSEDKLNFLLTQYNSIISSQLESQRFYYINLIKQIEESYSYEISKVTEEDNKLSFEIDYLENELKLAEDNKNKALIKFNNINNELKELKLINKLEDENLSKLTNTTNTSHNNSIDANKDILDYECKINKTNKEINNLYELIKEAKLNINLGNKLKNNNINNVVGLLGNSKLNKGKNIKK